ncbi:electron transfer flavoprotein subunit beta/FixA family protein [Thaumasiovibrio subtropicus]|uniref:electron transfer flavoprotein subunit beta/FixA family protein n=1 Tax=Thaumasiovibrio subtropicus TaxID=1891207 RepID=UPI000B361016|nr:electron transfer flavoprotein subunit beta/FixA family protein [Thaumasiovibrio subtropicus]
MQVLVGLKRVPDPYTKVMLKQSDAETVTIETKHIKHVINPFCEIALEQAIQLKEAGLVERVTVVSIGDEASVETLRAGLAMGADDAIHVHEDKPVEPLLVAKVFAALVKAHNAQLVLLGKQSIDSDNGQVPSMLAGLLDWPQASWISELRMSSGAVWITEESDKGMCELELQLPAVVSVDLRLNEPRFTSLPNIMKARTKPLSTLQLEDLGLVYEQRHQCVAYYPPKSRSAGEKVESVEVLLAAIKRAREAV